MRGMLTDAVATRARELLGKDIDTNELRLMPYIQYVMVNEQRLNPARVSASERRILADWRKRGWVAGGAGGITISKNFWDAINELLWLAYVDYSVGTIAV